MKKQLRFGLICLASLASLSAGRAALHSAPAGPAPAVSPANPVRLSLSVEKGREYVDAQSRPAVAWVGLTPKADGKTAEVHPGDLLRYRVAVENTGAKEVTGLVVTQPVPAGSVYVAHSADGPAPAFSLDRKTFSAQPLRTTVGTDGAARTAPAAPEAYVALRWRFGALPGGSSQAVTYQVKVR